MISFTELDNVLKLHANAILPTGLNIAYRDVSTTTNSLNYLGDRLDIDMNSDINSINASVSMYASKCRRQLHELLNRLYAINCEVGILKGMPNYSVHVRTTVTIIAYQVVLDMSSIVVQAVLFD